MNFLPNGKIMFNDVYEMFYHLFTEIGLGINNNSYLYDQDTFTEIKFKEKYIKATTQPITIYAGRNDIIFDPANNYQLMVSLLGYYIDKRAVSEDEETIEFVAQYIEETPGREKQRVTVKTNNKGDISSNFYYNIYLGYIEIIFLLGGNFVPDLSNFDIQQMR
jgi:hypothetical protein